jgi:hypothetical protein
MSEVNPSQVSKPIPTVRAQTLPLQGLVNVVIRGLLRAPLLSWAVGTRLMSIYVMGRKSGRHYAVPVAYTRHNGPCSWAVSSPRHAICAPANQWKSVS